jgi:putative pyruvate formate lyase activating enzyme
VRLGLSSCEFVDKKEKPAYLTLYEHGILAERAQLLDELLSSCLLCPRQCRVNRKAGQLGACGVDARPKVAAVNIHPWEEPPISGTRGSGTIFFSGCTLQCIFCQNYPISQLGVGRYMSVEELAKKMLTLQRKGAHNINLVTGTHQMAAVVKALLLAVRQGFSLPVVHNTSGYERVEILRLLEGIVDIYLPDIKYADSEVAQRCSSRADYVECNRLALLEMWRQVGPLKLDVEGIAYRGMLIRHLVLPEDLSGTADGLAFLAEQIGPEVWISLMHQYFPAHEAVHTPPFNRRVTKQEYERAFRMVTDFGLENGFVQKRTPLQP